MKNFLYLINVNKHINATMLAGVFASILKEVHRPHSLRKITQTRNITFGFGHNTLCISSALLELMS